MKKSVSTILSLAVAFSMFSSVAFGAATKTSNDFTDLKDLDAATKAKFDAMIGAGVFDGVSDTSFGYKDNMNRAQFAKVAALIFGLKVDSSLKTSTFSDVKADDPANGYALPYIEAIVKAGLTDGIAPGKYDPAGQVTKEQLATFLVRGLGLEDAVKASAGVKDASVSDWAKGYVAVALDKALFGAAATFGGTTPATRDLLVLSSYEAKQQYKPQFNGKYAISSLKATDANQLTVVLSGAVADTKEAKLSVTRNGVALASGYTTTWSKDNTTAVLTFDAKFNEATYNVTLSGLANIDDAAKTAEVKTAEEKIAKIEFLTASDTIANTTKKMRIDFKATNQYGKKSSLTASSFDIRTSSDVQHAAISGEQAFYLTLPGDVDRDDRAYVTVMHEDSAVQATKTFVVGDQPMVSKVEVGDLMNATGSKITQISDHGQAYLDIKAYDQYGVRVMDKELLNDDVNVVINDNDLESGQVGNNDPFVDSVIGDDAADLLLRSVSDEQKEVNVTVFARGGQSITKAIKLSSGNTPAAVEFGSYNYTLSQGDVPTGDEDMDAKFYVPLVIKDAEGNVLSGQDIYDRRANLRITSSSGVELAEPAISNSGAHKGMIAIKSVGTRNNAILTVQLDDNAMVRSELKLTINDERKADDLSFSTSPDKYMVANSDNEFAVIAKDQFADEMKFDAAHNYMVRYSLKANSGDAASLAAVTVASEERVNHEDAASARKYILPQPTAVGQETYLDMPLAANADDSITAYDKSFKFYAGSQAKAAAYTIKATLLKVDSKGAIVIGDKKYSEVDNVSSLVEVLDPTDVNNKLTYEAYLDEATTDNTILAADDYMDAGTGTVGAKTMVDNYRGFTKKVKVRVMKNGEKVSAPSNIVSVTSNNPQVAEASDADGSKYIAGGKEGKAIITVMYNNAKKEVQTSSLNVSTKNEGPEVKAISLKRTTKDVATADLKAGLYLWDAKMAEKLTVNDQFGGEFVAENHPGAFDDEGVYTDNEMVQASGQGFNNNAILKMSYYVSDVAGAKKEMVSVDANGIVKLDSAAAAGDVTSFQVNVMAPNGMQSSFTVTVK